MKPISRHFIKLKEFVVLAICVLISLILIFSNSSSEIEKIKILALELNGAVQQRFYNLSQYDSIEEQYRYLLSQNTKLVLENSRMREAIIENQRFRELFSFKEKSKFKLLPAKVIGINTHDFMNHVVLDVGVKDSVKRGMPIVLPEGLVGKIFQTSNNRSIAQLLYDKNFRVSAKILRSAVKGIVGWRSGPNCSLHEIPNRSDVMKNDIVITSGFNDIFPEGIYIGKIVSSINTKRSLFMNIELEPEIDFNRLEEVLVLMSEK